MKNSLFLILLICLVGCKKVKREYKELDFQLETYEWDENPYNFSSKIKDSILVEKGPQRAAWRFSYVGDIKNMHKVWDIDRTVKKDLPKSKRDSFSLFEEKNALKYILDQAKTHQVVIINEGHHMPQHRVFTSQLLQGLKQNGYQHLGLESYYASPKNDSILQAIGYPTLQSGFYTKEPQFGNLIRMAHEQAYNIFGYESYGHANGKEREINQAKNIQQYLLNHPNEKLLIHCGFDHGYEGALNSKWEKAMAGRFTEFTNINPLTINQVIYSERSEKKYENPYYQLTDVEKPSVFINQKGEIFGEYNNGGWFDIAVFHPRSNGLNRPKWMIFGDRYEEKFSFEDAKIDCPCLVLAYKKGEKIGLAVPYDIQETKEKSVNLILDKSDFEIVIWNKKGKALKTEVRNSN